MRAALYARVSTEDQASEGYSLEAQLGLLRAYCESEDWRIAGEYVDEGYSGRNTRRPRYREMMDRMDEWDTIVVLKMDRIHRNSMNFMAMMQLLERNGKGFVSSSESLDTQTAMGRFVVDMIQRIAQLESEQIGERTYLGMREKAESARGIMGFNPPFGYSLSDGRLTENQELPVVRDMFRMYLDGMTMDDICYRLNRSGARTRKGNVWNKFNMRNILHNPVYAGYMRWDSGKDGVLIPHDARKAVTKGEFNRVQGIMASRVRDPGKRQTHMIP